jgi:hypothetical protein
MLLLVVSPIQMALLLFVAVRSTARATDALITYTMLLGMVAYHGLGTVAGFLLYREKPIGLRLAKFWCGVSIAFALIVVASVFLSGEIVGAALLLLVGIPTAWLIYLYRSERVRNTYSENTAAEAAKVFR